MMEGFPSRADGHRRRVVLAGAGHAHLHILQRVAEFTRRGFEFIAVAPENFWYSGLATGVLGGEFSPEQDQVDVEALVRAGGGAFRRERVLGIDPARRILRLTSGELAYDVLSLNLGSESGPIPSDGKRVFAVKPLRELWHLRQAIERERSLGKRSRILVAGGGASGCEIAANVRALAGPDAEITIIARGERLASPLGAGAAGALRRELLARGITILNNTTVVRVEELTATTACGRSLPFDYLINAMGLHPPCIMAESGLPVSSSGELLVDDYLRAQSSETIFGGGDGVRFGAVGLPKIGVYAVRQSAVLYDNLLATLEGRPLRRFRPQKSYLLILNLGGGCGLACWRSFFWTGRTAGWLKRWIDLRFLGQSRSAA